MKLVENELLLIWVKTLYFFVQKTEMLEHRMFTHPLHKDSSLESLYGQYEQKAKVTVGFEKENYCMFNISIDLNPS